MAIIAVEETGAIEYPCCASETFCSPMTKAFHNESTVCEAKRMESLPLICGLRL